MKNVKEHLESLLHGKASPFLFVGAGISRRYGGTEGWEGLLRQFASKTSKPYGYYRTNAGDSLPQIASLIANDFNTLWWESPEYEESREIWGDKISKPDSPLKVEIARDLSTAVERFPDSGTLAQEIELLKRAVVDGIITTNYDPILETLFPSFRTFVGQEELLFSISQGIGEIYKIHGSYSDPESIVLTEADYDAFEEKNPYLAAKLLTIFVEHPIIFLGYSLEDPNVTSILNSIVKALSSEKVQELENRLIFVQWEENSLPRISSHTVLTDTGAILPVQRIAVPDFVGIFEVLTELKRSFSAKQLRQLKEQVYELVLTDDPENKLFVSDIEDDTDASEIEVVFGVGVAAKLGEVGYSRGISRWDLIDDVVGETQRYQARPVVEKALPRILRESGNVPVFKYLFEAGYLDSDGSIKSNNVPQSVIQRARKNREVFHVSKAATAKAPSFLKGVTGLADIYKKAERSGLITYAVYLEPDLVDLDELSKILKWLRKDLKNSWEETQFVKLVCFWDRLKYGSGKDLSSEDFVERL